MVQLEPTIDIRVRRVAALTPEKLETGEGSPNGFALGPCHWIVPFAILMCLSDSPISRRAMPPGHRDPTLAARDCSRKRAFRC